MKRVLESTKKFHREFRKSIATAVVTALGIIMALAWKDVISSFISKITSLSPVQNFLINALIITVISVAIIMIVTHLSPSD
ncbi:MAG: DUF5654 family protein [Candidatus Pacearchaeota archaeon]|nr:DUF5654 family protein [Candidatus Pacearchaeota archaeon]